jgi:hypothetical protein
MIAPTMGVPWTPLSNFDVPSFFFTLTVKIFSTYFVTLSSLGRRPDHAKPRMVRRITALFIHGHQPTSKSPAVPVGLMASLRGSVEKPKEGTKRKKSR